MNHSTNNIEIETIADKFQILSDELSIALKNKGFQEICFGYHLSKDLRYNKKGLHFGSSNYIGNHNNSDEFICSAPMLFQVVDWLKTKHSIVVEYSTTYNSEGFVHFCKISSIINDTYNSFFIKDPKSEEIGITMGIEMYEIFDSPESAITAGIEYTLKKLI